MDCSSSTSAITINESNDDDNPVILDIQDIGAFMVKNIENWLI